MSTIDILKSLLGSGQGYTTPEGGVSPIIQMLEKSGVVPPAPDKGAEMRKAISRGLLGLSQTLASSKEDFLPALAQGMAQGAGGFLDARDATDKTSRDRAQDLMKEMFGIAKAEDLSNYRAGSLEQRTTAAETRAAQADERLAIYEKLGLGRLAQGDARLSQGDTRLEQGDRRLDITERQGDERLGQGDRRLDETGRHNAVTEGQGDTRIEQGQQGLDNRAKDAESRNKIAQERHAIQKQRAELDRQRLENDIGKQGLDRKNTETTIMARVAGMKKDKAKELGLDDPLSKVIDPEGHEAKVQEYRTYGEELDKQIKGIGQTNDQGASPLLPQPVPQPKEAETPQVKHTEKNPARPMSQAEFDALPPGSVFVNPKTGKLRRKPANGGQVPTQ